MTATKQASLILPPLPELATSHVQKSMTTSCNSGQMLAGLLKWPQATFASKVEIDQAAKQARVTREVQTTCSCSSMPLTMLQHAQYPMEMTVWLTTS